MNCLPVAAASRWLGSMVVGVAVFAGLGQAVNAMTIREMRAMEKREKLGSTYSDYYLVGVMEGVLEAHTQAVRNGATPRICLHGYLPEPRMARSLFSAELMRNIDLYEVDMPVQLVMHNALVAVYPCV